MNQWEVEKAAQRYNRHIILGPATQTLENLMEWTNHNSDGWAYWPKPARAAAKLMEIIDRDRGFDRPDITPNELRKAMSSIKAFRTRQNADFEIVEI